MIFSLQIALSFIILCNEIFRSKKYQFDFFTLFNVVYFICYVVAPISGFFMKDEWQKYSVMRYTIKGVQYDNPNFYSIGILTILTYLIIVFSFSFFRYRTSIYKKSLFFVDDDYRFLLKYTKVLFFISVLALLYSAYSAGGLLKWMVSNPRLYYANDALEVEEQSWILSKLTRCIIICCYFYFALILHLKSKKIPITIWTYIFFATSFLLSLVVVIHSGGRFLMFQFFGILFLTFVIGRRLKFDLKKVAIVVLFGGSVLLYGRTFFQFFIYDNALDSLREKSSESGIDKFFGVMNNYTFPFFSAINNFSYDFLDWNFFRDFLLWPLNFLPPSFRPNFEFDSTAINTFRLMGEYKRFVPSDVISYGLINFGVTGVLIVSVFFGWLLKYFNSTIDLTNRNYLASCIYSILAFLICFRVMYFDPYHFIKGSFEFISIIFFIPFFRKIKTE